MNLKRYKEIIISIIIILVISGVLGIKYFNKYEKIEISNNDINKEDASTQYNKKEDAMEYKEIYKEIRNYINNEVSKLESEDMDFRDFNISKMLVKGIEQYL